MGAALNFLLVEENILLTSVQEPTWTLPPCEPASLTHRSFAIKRHHQTTSRDALTLKNLKVALCASCFSVSSLLIYDVGRSRFPKTNQSRQLITKTVI